MSGTDLEYGWYKWQDGFRQTDGFFVDRAGRVLYWPSASAPGYVVTEREIEEIHTADKEKKDFINWKQVHFYTVAVVIILIIYFVTGDLISWGVFSYYNMAFSAVFPLCAWWLYKVTKPRREGVDLSHLQKVAARRPAVRDVLVPAKAKPADEFWAPIGFGAIGLLMFSACVGALVRDDVAEFLEQRYSEDLLGAASFILFLGVGLAYSGFCAFRRIRARYAPHSLEDLTSRILVTEGLKAWQLMNTTDRSEPISEAQMAANYPELNHGIEPQRGRDPGRPSEA